MTIRPINHDAAYFHQLLGALLGEKWPVRVCLGSTVTCPRLAQGEGRENIHPMPRLMLLLEGRQRYDISRHGLRQTVWLEPGECLFMPPQGWSVEFWDTPCVMFGLVFWTGYLRCLIVDHAGDGIPQQPTPFTLHTAQSLGGAGAHVVAALSDWARGEADLPEAPALLTTLLRSAQTHLQNDLANPPSVHHKARHTWLQVQHYLQEHYASPINRESTATALGLNPNYLSALARAQAGCSFQDLLESIRMGAAERLLRDTNFTVARIADLCGYQSAAYFVTRFRKRTGSPPDAWRRRA